MVDLARIPCYSKSMLKSVVSEVFCCTDFSMSFAGFSQSVFMTLFMLHECYLRRVDKAIIKISLPVFVDRTQLWIHSGTASENLFKRIFGNR